MSKTDFVHELANQLAEELTRVGWNMDPNGDQTVWGDDSAPLGIRDDSELCQALRKIIEPHLRVTDRRSGSDRRLP